MQEKERELAQVRKEKASAISRQQYELAAQLRDKEAILEMGLTYEKSNYDRAIGKQPEVTEEDIAAVISQWLNIPLQKLTQTESERLLHMEDDLHKRVIGQSEAVEAVSKAIRRARAGFKDKNRPVGSFLFLGPTGVGKTELAKALAENMFGDERALIRFDMSEYMEKHTASRLVARLRVMLATKKAASLRTPCAEGRIPLFCLTKLKRHILTCLTCFCRLWRTGALPTGRGAQPISATA